MTQGEAGKIVSRGAEVSSMHHGHYMGPGVASGLGKTSNSRNLSGQRVSVPTGATHAPNSGSSHNAVEKHTTGVVTKHGNTTGVVTKHGNTVVVDSYDISHGNHATTTAHIVHQPNTYISSPTTTNTSYMTSGARAGDKTYHTNGTHHEIKRKTSNSSSSSSSSSKYTGRLVTNRTYYDDRVIVIPTKEVVRERSFKSVPVKKRIIEVEKAYEVEETVEIPEIEIIEEIEEREVRRVINRTIEKPVEQYVEIIKEIPIEQIEEVVVEVPEVRYNDIVTEKIIEVPTTKEVVKTIEKRVPIYRDEIRTIEKEVKKNRDITRKIPVPVEARISQHFTVPNLKKKYKTHKYEAVIPEFQEYAVHKSALTTEGLNLLSSIHDTLNQPSVGLCHLETLYHDVKNQEFLEEPTFVSRMRIQQDILNHMPHLANVHNIHYRDVALEDLSCSVKSRGGSKMSTRTPLPSRSKQATKKGTCC